MSFIIVVTNSRNKIVQFGELFQEENAAQQSASDLAKELQARKARGEAKGYPMVRVFDLNISTDVIGAGKKYLTEQDLNSRYTGGACVGAYCGW